LGVWIIIHGMALNVYCNGMKSMTSPQKPNAERSAKIFGCSIEQAKRLMAQNANGLLKMADKAASTGKKVNGYTESELRLSAADYLAASV